MIESRHNTGNAKRLNKCRDWERDLYGSSIALLIQSVDHSLSTRLIAPTVHHPNPNTKYRVNDCPPYRPEVRCEPSGLRID